MFGLYQLINPLKVFLQKFCWT